MTLPAFKPAEPSKPASPFYTATHAYGDAHARKTVAETWKKLLADRKTALASATTAKERAFADAYVELAQIHVAHQLQQQRTYEALATGDVGEAIMIARGGAMPLPIRHEGGSKR